MIIRLLCLFSMLIFFSCSRKLYPDRSQFLRLGEPAPTVSLSSYRSVQERPGQDSTLAVALAISGGGSRAANFALGIMLGLEEIALGEGQDALDQVDYISTVSGGGFAGGAYIAALYEHYDFKREAPFSLRQYFERQIRQDLARSYVTPLLFANFNPLLWFSPIDDGDALEKSIDDHVLGYKRRRPFRQSRSIRLGDLFVPADSSREQVRFPMHITNSSVINTLAIFPFTPDILESYQIDGYSHRMRLFYEEEDFDPYQVPLSVGIKSSGSFPVLISNTTLRSRYNPGRRFLHLMDGAMTDNLGYYTAVDLLRQEYTPRRVLFIADAEAGLDVNTFSKKEGAIFSLRVLGGLTTSGLYARKNLLPQELEALQNSEGILSFVFTIKSLLDENAASPPPVIRPQEHMLRLISLMKKDLNSLSDADEQILYELVNNIGTKYTIKPEEQELLVLTGRKLVHMQAMQIRAALQREP